jgi:hypothetical protein
MEKMSSIPAVPLLPTVVPSIPKVVMLRDRMDKIVYHLKWIEKILCVCVCVHSCCSVCNTNEVDGHVNVCSCI